MATTINEQKEITLLDGTTFAVRPLKISLLRKFMKKFEDIANVAEDNNDSLDVLLACVAIALQQYAPELADDKDLEEKLDLPLVYKIVEEASGIKLGDADLIGGLG
jgi:mRNA-degrading endonuclease YafQ of YafQ-DinJ toxin-antitoxin module